MDKTNDNPRTKGTAAETAQTKPGVAVDIADNDRTSPEMVKEDTAELNNNPRNNEADV